MQVPVCVCRVQLRQRRRSKIELLLVHTRIDCEKICHAAGGGQAANFDRAGTRSDRTCEAATRRARGTSTVLLRARYSVYPSERSVWQFCSTSSRRTTTRARRSFHWLSSRFPFSCFSLFFDHLLAHITRAPARGFTLPCLEPRGTRRLPTTCRRRRVWPPRFR